MPMARIAGWSVACAVLFLSPGAHAAGVRVGLGADYWFHEEGVFDLTVAVEGRLARRVTVGGRFGGLITSGPTTVGVPIDLVLRAELDRLYLEGMAGPWILFERAAPLRAHGAFGFGLQGPDVAFGVELGWLDPRPIAGIRLAFRV